MNQSQITAIRCAYLDLVGSYQAHLDQPNYSHEWDAHLTTIEEMENVFSEILSDLIIDFA